MSRYWADANVFIWGSQVPYPLERARAYWNWFDRKLDEGILVSPERVYREVTKGRRHKDDDPIIGWVLSRKSKGLSIVSDKDVQELVGRICSWVFENFGAIKAQEFLKGADPYLIAHASLEGGTVVTQESQSKALRIPAVCKAFNVRCITLFEMNNELGAEFGS